MIAPPVKSGSRRAFLLSGLAALAVMAWIWQGMATRCGVEMDEGMTLIYPELLLDGWRVHGDFESFYGPGSLWFLAGWYRLFGCDVHAARLAGAAYQLLILSGLHRFLRPFGPMISAASVVTAGLLLSPLGLTPFAWLPAIGLLIWVLVVVSPALESDHPQFWKFLLGGLLSGFALTVRQDLGVAMIAMGAIVWRVKGLRSAFLLGAGIAMGLLPLCAHAMVVGWRALWENLFLYPVILTRATRNIPLALSAISDRMLALSAAWAIVLALAIPLLSKATQTKKTLLHTGGRLTWAGILSLCIFPQMLQRLDAPHSAFVVFLPISLLWPICLTYGNSLRQWPVLNARSAGILSAIPLLVPLLGILLWSPSLLRDYGMSLIAPVRNTPLENEIQIGPKRFYASSKTQAVLFRYVLDYLILNSRPGDRIIVGPHDLRFAMANDTFVYHLLYPRLIPGTYFLEMNPGSANRPGSRLYNDIQSVQWVLLNKIYAHWKEPNDSMQPGDPSAQHFLRENFDRVLTVDVLELYRRRVH